MMIVYISKCLNLIVHSNEIVKFHLLRWREEEDEDDDNVQVQNWLSRGGETRKASEDL